MAPNLNALNMRVAYVARNPDHPPTIDIYVDREPTPDSCAPTREYRILGCAPLGAIDVLGRYTTVRIDSLNELAHMARVSVWLTKKPGSTDEISLGSCTIHMSPIN